MVFPRGQKSNFHFQVTVKGISDDQLPLNSSSLSSWEFFQAVQVEGSNLMEEEGVAANFSDIVIRRYLTRAVPVLQNQWGGGGCKEGPSLKYK